MSRYFTPSAPADAPLFAQPRARATDPATSHEAAAKHAKRAGTNADRILAELIQRPGYTATELVKYLPDSIDRHEVSRRLADLERAGRVRKGHVRACEVKGSNMTTWWPEVSP